MKVYIGGECMWMIGLLYGACISTNEPIVEEDVTVSVQQNLQEHVLKLSSDNFLGRGTFEPGLDMAAAYIAAEFQKYGLSFIDGRGSYISTYPLHQYSWETNSTLSIGGTIVPNTQWQPYKFEDKISASHTVHLSNVPVVFVGYGIDAPEQDWNDYTDLDVRGKVVVVMRRKPESIESMDHATFDRKAAVAQENGAVGMLVFTDPSFPDDRLKRGDADFRKEIVLSTEPFEESTEMNHLFRNVIRSGENFASIRISPDLIAPMFPENTLSEIQGMLDKGGSPATISMTPTTISLDWTEADASTGSTSVDVPNVIGMIEGTDPKLKGEMVVIGAHFDHLGAFETSGDGVFNGADDNASGTAGLLELARMFSQGPKPKRSVVFVAFSAEELGLLGSEAFSKQIDISSVSLMLNLDMIGRNSDKSLMIIGDGFSTEMESRLTPIAKELELPLEFARSAYFGASDHDHFYRANRPFLFFFTGTHDDYHTVNDHIEHLDFERMTQIVHLGHQITQDIASAEYTPQFMSDIGWLGISGIDDEDGFRIHNVRSNSKALSLGFLVGDLLLNTETEQKTLEMLQALAPEEPVVVQIQRGEQQLSVDITRHTSGYMGIYPDAHYNRFRNRESVPEGTGLKINVAADGPAAQAGLQDGDVILKVDGQDVSPVWNGEEHSLTAILQHYAVGEELACVILRGEEEQRLSVTLGERPR